MPGSGDVASSDLRYLSALQEATAGLAGALTVEQAVATITDSGARTLGADWAGVALLERDDWHWVSTSPVVGGVVAGPQVSTEAAAVYVTDASDPTDGSSGRSPERSWAVVPLLDAHGVIGALRYAFHEPRRLTPAERTFVEALAGQCSLAVHRAQLIDREHAAAVTLQRALLPAALPRVAGLELAARYPTSGEGHLGGWGLVRRAHPRGRAAVAVGG